MMKEASNDPLVAMAKAAVEQYVRSGKKPTVPSPLPDELTPRAGAFVCLKTHGRLRGCIGTIEPTQANLAGEIINNAVSSAVNDPRFMPVGEHELDDLEYTVDVLGDAEQVTSLDELDHKKYGVIVESGYKRGLLLPDLEGVDTVEDQIDIAMHKAGITQGEPVTLYRFQVTRHE
jgi:MEMO1 family protein